MKEFFKKHWLKFAGVLAGAIGGYLYYRFIGCGTDSCPITSNPWRVTAYGSIMGLLLFDIFKRTRRTLRSKKKTKKRITRL